MHQIGIESSLIEAVRRGDKTIEGRLGKPRFLHIQVGDILSIREDIWSDGHIIDTHDDALRVKVSKVLHFKSFREMLEAIDFVAAVPTAKNIDEAIKKYAEFYSTKDEEEYGTIALYFELAA